jgi:hypothetical protein
MLKQLPEDTWKNLFYPPRDYKYFEDCAQHDFEPDAQDFSPVNAWWLADAAVLAYVKEPGEVERSLAAARIEEKFRPIGNDEEKSTKGFFVSRSQPRPFAMVAFRGTDKDDKRNLDTDLDTVPVERDNYVVHRGFAQALDQVWESEVIPAINDFLATHPGAPVYFTGHSLGAALATIAVTRFQGTHCALYTIGSPRVGDDRFIRAVLSKTRLVFRFVNCQDIVTQIPPEIPLEHFFRHVGREKYFDRYGKVLDDPSELVKALDVVPAALEHDKIGMVKLLADPLEFLTACRTNPNPPGAPPFVVGNHSPGRYPILIWNAYMTAP